MSLGPLTTNFVPPPSCTNSVTNFYATTPVAGIYLVGGPLSTSNCFPPHYEFARSNFYSPGICPEGYTSACSSLNTVGTATETAVTCCPSMFDCDTSTYYDWQKTMGCSSSFISLATTLTVITNGLTSTIFTTLTGGARNAYSVQVVFQASDFQSTTHTHSTTPALTSTPTRTSTVTATYTFTVSNSGGGNITSGVAAAIGVCSAIGAFLVSALIASIFFRRLRIERRQQRVEMAAQARPNAWPHELPAQLQ